MKLCFIGRHQYIEIKKEYYCRMEEWTNEDIAKFIYDECDNCEALGLSAFPEGTRKYFCNCGKIKYENNICEICGYYQKI